MPHYSHEAMATVFEVHCSHPDARYAAQAAHAAFDLVDRLEAQLSRFIPNSDIGRINNLAAGESTRVGAETMECLVIARHMFDVTGGRFDVSIGSGLPSLELHAGESVVQATADGVKLDLGGIGKGYAVDRMAELLEDWDVTHALIHGGFSSILALDPPADSDGWPLTLSDPGDPSRVLTRLSARHAALGASGILKSDHIVDPHTGEPVRSRQAAWVMVPAPTRTPSGVTAGVGASAGGPPDGKTAAIPRAAAVADALATACMMMSVTEIEGLCESNHGVEAWLLEEPASSPLLPSPLLHIGGA